MNRVLKYVVLPPIVGVLSNVKRFVLKKQAHSPKVR
jgi:hypothetical protein